MASSVYLINATNDFDIRVFATSRFEMKDHVSLVAGDPSPSRLSSSQGSNPSKLWKICCNSEQILSPKSRSKIIKIYRNNIKSVLKDRSHESLSYFTIALFLIAKGETSTEDSFKDWLTGYEKVLEAEILPQKGSLSNLSGLRVSSNNSLSSRSSALVSVSTSDEAFVPTIDHHPQIEQLKCNSESFKPSEALSFNSLSSLASNVSNEGVYRHRYSPLSETLNLLPIVQIKLKLRFHKLSSKLYYSLSSIPSDSLDISHFWSTSRKQKKAYWSAFDKIFEITSRSVFTGANDDIEYCITDVFNDGKTKSNEQKIEVDEIWENERDICSTRTNFSPLNLFSNERGRWSTANGEPSTSTFDHVLNDETWSWITEWSVDIGNHTDEYGWQYAFNWGSMNWDKTAATHYFVRRRKWIRKRKQGSL